MIFHSYVSLPEGIKPGLRYDWVRADPWHALPQWLKIRSICICHGGCWKPECVRLWHTGFDCLILLSKPYTWKHHAVRARIWLIIAHVQASKPPSFQLSFFQYDPNIIYCLVVLAILKNMKVNGKDYPIYYWKKHVWNHQPDYSSCSYPMWQKWSAKNNHHHPLTIPFLHTLDISRDHWSRGIPGSMPMGPRTCRSLEAWAMDGHSGLPLVMKGKWTHQTGEFRSISSYKMKWKFTSQSWPVSDTQNLPLVMIW